MSLDRLIAEVVAARAAATTRSGEPEPGRVRRAEAALQREIGVGDITTVLQAHRWEAEQAARLRHLAADPNLLP